MQIRDKLYIGGQWIAPASPAFLQVHSASTEEVVARVPDGAQADVERAVAAARAAFDGWSRTSPGERASSLGRIQAGLKARAEDVARTIATEVGTPLKMAQRIQAALPVSSFGLYTKLVTEFAFEEQ